MKHCINVLPGCVLWCFSHSLECRTCVVVGNGFVVKNSSLGSLINKYDVVIRWARTTWTISSFWMHLLIIACLHCIFVLVPSFCFCSESVYTINHELEANKPVLLRFYSPFVIKTSCPPRLLTIKLVVKWVLSWGFLFFFRKPCLFHCLIPQSLEPVQYFTICVYAEKQQ